MEREDERGGSRRSQPLRVGRGNRTWAIIVVCALSVILIGACLRIMENLDVHHIMMVQSPRGKITWYTDQGIKMVWLGRVVKYPKRAQYDFLLPKAWKRGDKSVGEAIEVRFNDGGHGWISGSIAWKMPLDKQHLDRINSQYGSEQALVDQLIKRVMDKCVYMTGPLMSSQESFAARRSELLNFIEDQAKNGVYRTVTESRKEPDPMTGELKTVQVVRIVEKMPGVPSREDVSPLSEFGIEVFNLSIAKIPYENKVEDQIAAQQQNNMELQTAITKARRSEQDAITAKKTGEAEAAKAKWLQEVIKAKAVTEAQQKLEVARLDAQAAEQTRRKLILEGEGEGSKRRLIMSADGGLDKKLQTYLQAQTIWADAVKGYQGAWMPQIVMGGSARSGGGAMDLLSLLTAKTAKDLALDMGMVGSAQTKGQAGQGGGQ